MKTLRHGSEIVWSIQKNNTEGNFFYQYKTKNGKYFRSIYLENEESKTHGIERLHSLWNTETSGKFF